MLGPAFYHRWVGVFTQIIGLSPDPVVSLEKTCWLFISDHITGTCRTSPLSRELVEALLFATESGPASPSASSAYQRAEPARQLTRHPADAIAVAEGRRVGVARLSLLARALGACARCGHLMQKSDLLRISSDLVRGLPAMTELAGPAAGTAALWALGR